MLLSRLPVILRILLWKSLARLRALHAWSVASRLPPVTVSPLRNYTIHHRFASLLTKAIHQTVYECKTASEASPFSSSRRGGARQSGLGHARSRGNAPPREAAGLTKIQAEDLLDRLEAAGYEVCQLSYADHEGFRVRAMSCI